jgi:hypothetical protein
MINTLVTRQHLALVDFKTFIISSPKKMGQPPPCEPSWNLSRLPTECPDLNCSNVLNQIPLK